MCRTAAGNVWRIREDVGRGRAELAALASAEPVVQEFKSRPPAMVRYREVLEREAPVVQEYRGPAFLFPEELPEAPRAVVDPSLAACDAHYPWVRAEWGDPIHPVVVALEDGVAVSVCHSARFAERAAEAGVETLEAARGRGYAVEVVAEWARAIRESGRLPTYGTTWDNAASRRVAAKLGLELYGEDLSLD
jgi:RimJ/RimL family protein N-acetyltransferase